MQLRACPATLCTTSTCCFVFRAELGQVDLCSNLVVGRGSPIPPAALCACGEQCKQRWCHWQVPCQPSCLGRGDVEPVPRTQWVRQPGAVQHTPALPCTAGKEQPLPFASHVFAARAPLGRALQRAQASGAAAASPACCQGGWISLSNQQEAVRLFSATWPEYRLRFV